MNMNMHSRQKFVYVHDHLPLVMSLCDLFAGPSHTRVQSLSLPRSIWMQNLKLCTIDPVSSGIYYRQF